MKRKKNAAETDARSKKPEPMHLRGARACAQNRRISRIPTAASAAAAYPASPLAITTTTTTTTITPSRMLLDHIRVMN